MITRTFIARRTGTGYEGVYCHFDYPGGALLGTLRYCYRDSEAVEHLLQFGELLRPDPTRGESGYRKGCVNDHLLIALSRLQFSQEMQNRPDQFQSMPALLKHAANIGCEFVFVFRNGQWDHCWRPKPLGPASNGEKFSPFVTGTGTVIDNQN